jgi:hypothetical protein
VYVPNISLKAPPVWSSLPITGGDLFWRLIRLATEPTSCCQSGATDELDRHQPPMSFLDQPMQIGATESHRFPGRLTAAYG